MHQCLALMKVFQDLLGRAPLHARSDDTDCQVSSGSLTSGLGQGSSGAPSPTAVPRSPDDVASEVAQHSLTHTHSSQDEGVSPAPPPLSGGGSDRATPLVSVRIPASPLSLHGLTEQRAAHLLEHLAIVRGLVSCSHAELAATVESLCTLKLWFVKSGFLYCDPKDLVPGGALFENDRRTFDRIQGWVGRVKDRANSSVPAGNSGRFKVSCFLTLFTDFFNCFSRLLSSPPYALPYALPPYALTKGVPYLAQDLGAP